MYVVLDDAYSKWIEVWPVSSTNFESLEEKLLMHFATYGPMLQVVTDNGPPFQSQEFKDFCTKHSIIVTKSPPYHPASNGLAERAVQTVKKALEKIKLENCNISKKDLLKKLCKFLFAYRNTPITGKDVSPCDLVLKQTPRTTLNLIHPKKQPKAPKLPNLSVNETVLVRMSKQHQVQKGVIHKQISPTTYLIKVNGEIKLCHLNQIKLTTLSDLELKQKPSPYPTVDPLNLAMMQSSASTSKPQIQLAPKITNVISPSSPVKKQQPVPHTGNTRRALSFNETNAILPGTSNSRQTLRQSGTPQPHNSRKRPSVPQNSNSPEWQIESSSEQPSSSRTKTPEPPVTPPAPPPRKSSRESKPPMRLNL